MWARCTESGDVRVGLTDRPRAFLGDVVHVELPEPRTDVVAGEPIGLVESSSAVCEVVTPVSGVIVEINPAAGSSPEKIAADPYGEGWLLTIRPQAPVELDSLMSGEEYDRLTGGE